MTAPMPPHQIELLEETFTQVMKSKHDVGIVFYNRLFEVAPDLRSMFGNDIAVQGTKLMDILGYTISSLHDSPALDQSLEALGQRHKAYGVRPSHYVVVGKALMWTLTEVLGPSFENETRAAWNALYRKISLAMMSSHRPRKNVSASEIVPRDVWTIRVNEFDEGYSPI